MWHRLQPDRPPLWGPQPVWFCFLRNRMPQPHTLLKKRKPPFPTALRPRHAFALLALPLAHGPGAHRISQAVNLFAQRASRRQHLPLRVRVVERHVVIAERTVARPPELALDRLPIC